MRQVIAALLVSDGRILIAQRQSTDAVPLKWEFPGGKVEPGESSAQCLQREIREEFQIEIRVHGFFASSVYCYEHGCFELLAYWASYDSSQTLVPTAHEQYRWVGIDELVHFDFAPADIPLVERLAEVIDPLT